KHARRVGEFVQSQHDCSVSLMGKVSAPTFGMGTLGSVVGFGANLDASLGLDIDYSTKKRLVHEDGYVYEDELVIGSSLSSVEANIGFGFTSVTTGGKQKKDPKRFEIEDNSKERTFTTSSFGFGR